MPQCKNCQKDFTIYPEDKEFYQKIGVPEPTWCPQCRQQRRLVWRNERTLYQRKCDLSGQDIIAVYPADSPFKVYEPEEWHSDKWEGMDYGREFDFSRGFFEQFAELQKEVPRPALGVIQITNSPFVNQCWNTKDSYMCFDMGFTENALYCGATYHSKDVVDCLFIRNCELSYFLIDCQNCYNSAYLQDCSDCHDAFFSYDCKGCSNIAFSYNLRNQKNKIFNQAVSSEEFSQFLKEIKQGFYKKFEKYYNDWKNQVIRKAIHKFNHNIKVINCSGDYLLNSKNCHDCYDCESSEDLRYCCRMDEQIFSSLDADQLSIAELVYEGQCITGSDLKFCLNVWSSSSACWYCDLIMSCNDCFGCIGIKHKKYCILNKQYSEAEYKKLAGQIKEQMRKTGEFGEFFPYSVSPFAYNETVANEYYPLTKEEVVARNGRWKDDLPGTFGKETMKSKEIPDKIGEVKDEIIREILVCSKCQKNYKIISQELNFYQRQSLPLPRLCPFCRHLDRLSFRNPRQLWQRQCSNCQRDIKTTYLPERSEKVYCEECYRNEIY